MFKTLKGYWNIPEMRHRIIFTLLMVIVFRLGNSIPIPFMNRDVIEKIMSNEQGGIVSLLNMLSGGSLSRMSVFALSIYPYITASIIVQLLTVVFPRLRDLQEEGEEGRKKMGKYTKIATIFLAVIQGYATVNGLFRNAIVKTTPWAFGVILLTIIAGSMFLVWLGEAITEKGIGNGISILIFLGIVSNIPNQIGSLMFNRIGGGLPVWKMIVLALISMIVLIVVIMISQGERRIPVQYAKRVVGRKMYGGRSTHIPLKVNMAGVMPVIFSSALLSLPQTIALLFNAKMPTFLQHIFTVQTTSGLIIYSIVNVFLILIFAYFYTAIQFNVYEYAKNLQKYGGYIPGIRPGRPTITYLQTVSNRITFIGAISLALVAAAPMLITRGLGVRVVFGGTSIIILVGVILDTMKQMESMITMKQYKGFLN